MKRKKDKEPGQWKKVSENVFGTLFIILIPVMFILGLVTKCTM